MKAEIANLKEKLYIASLRADIFDEMINSREAVNINIRKKLEPSSDEPAYNRLPQI